MDTIFLDEKLIQTATITLSRTLSDLSDAVNRLYRLHSQIDGRILSRSDAGGRLVSLCKELDDLQDRLESFRRFAENESKKYFDIDDYLAKLSLSFSSSLLEQYEYRLTVDPLKILASRNALTDLFSGVLNSENLLRYKDLRFTTYEQNGKVFIKLVGAQMTAGWHYNHYRDLLVELSGGHTAMFKKRFVERLINGGGVPIYVTGRGIIQDNMNRFNKFNSIKQYINGREQPISNMKSVFQSSFSDGLKIWDDFNWSNTSTLSKSGKFLGAAGTLISIGDNMVDAFRDDGEWNWSGKNFKEFTVNTGVDLASGAAAAAAGAVAGSMIVPPLGTVLGLVAGVSINFVINTKFGGPPPKSVVDHTKDFVNDLVNDGVDKVKGEVEAMQKTASKIAGNVGKTLDRIFW